MMPWCPNCRSEYRAGFTVCPTCGVYLLEALPDKEQFVRLTTFSDDRQRALAVRVLRDAGICVYCKDRGPGSYVRIITGSSIFGEDLYVPISCQRAALEQIAPLLETEDAPRCSDEEFNAAYERYMQTHEAPSETADKPVSPSGYRIMLCFLGGFALLCLLALLKQLF